MNRTRSSRRRSVHISRAIHDRGPEEGSHTGSDSMADGEVEVGDTITVKPRLRASNNNSNSNIPSTSSSRPGSSSANTGFRSGPGMAAGRVGPPGSRGRMKSIVYLVMHNDLPLLLLYFLLLHHLLLLFVFLLSSLSLARDESNDT